MERFTTAPSTFPTSACTSPTACSSPDTITTGTPKYPAMVALIDPSDIGRPLSFTAENVALEIVCARTPCGFVVAEWYPMNMTALKVESMPSIIINGRGEPRIIVTPAGNRSMSKFCMLPCASATTNSVAPASRAPAMAANASAVMYSRNFAYSKPVGLSCSDVTTPPMPSMSTEMNTLRGRWAASDPALSASSSVARANACENIITAFRVSNVGEFISVTLRIGDGQRPRVTYNAD